MDEKKRIRAIAYQALQEEAYTSLLLLAMEEEEDEAITASLPEIEPEDV